VLDGEVGDAAGGGHFARPRDCLGGAGADAGSAFSAMIRRGGIGLDFEGGEQFGEEEPGAEFPVDLDGGLAIPA